MYTVAATPTAQPTQGGPAIVPTYTFADTRSARAPRADVVVVPLSPTADGPAEAPLRAWVTDQAAAGARILSVCNGGRVLAAPACSTDAPPPPTGPDWRLRKKYPA